VAEVISGLFGIMLLGSDGVGASLVVSIGVELIGTLSLVVLVVADVALVVVRLVMLPVAALIGTHSGLNVALDIWHRSTPGMQSYSPHRRMDTHSHCSSSSLSCTFLDIWIIILVFFPIFFPNICPKAQSPLWIPAILHYTSFPDIHIRRWNS
jgi:hypothetical protein